MSTSIACVMFILNARAIAFELNAFFGAHKDKHQVRCECVDRFWRLDRCARCTVVKLAMFANSVNRASQRKQAS